MPGGPLGDMASLLVELVRLGGDFVELLEILGVSQKELPTRQAKALQGFDLEDMLELVGKLGGRSGTGKIAGIPRDIQKAFKELGKAGKQVTKEFSTRIKQAKTEAGDKISTKTGVIGAIDMERVASSNVYAIGYDEQTGTMRIQFNRHVRVAKGGKFKATNTLAPAPGAVYDYYDVPPRKWRSFQAAGSKGKWVWDNLRIRGTISGARYDYRLVLGVDFGVNARKERVVYLPRLATAGRFKRRVRIVGGAKVISSLPTQMITASERGFRFTRGK